MELRSDYIALRQNANIVYATSDATSMQYIHVHASVFSICMSMMMLPSQRALFVNEMRS